MLLYTERSVTDLENLTRLCAALDNLLTISLAQVSLSTRNAKRIRRKTKTELWKRGLLFYYLVDG